MALGSDGQTVLAGTQGGGVFKSSDGGANWTAINAGLGHLDVRSLVLDGQTVLAGTWGGGVFKSSDGGASWAAANVGLGQLFVSSLLVDGLRVLVGTSGGVFKSGDGGANWVAANAGLGNLSVHSLVLDGQTVLAGTQGGVFKSSDGGASWAAANAGLGTLNVRALALDGPTVLAGTQGGGVFKSGDGGANWTAINAGLGHLDVRSLVLDGQTVLAGTWGGGVFKSGDGGANWAAANTGLGHLDVYSLALDGPTVLAGTWGGGVFKSSDGGANWAAANAGLGYRDVYSLVLDGQTVLAGTAGSGVFKSSDGGANWMTVNAGLGHLFVSSLIVDGQTVLAGTAGGGVFKSSDGGANWAAANAGLGHLNVRALVLDGQTVLAGTQGGVFKSGDGGANWAAANTGLGHLDVYSLVLDGQKALAGTQGGVFKSGDGGANWAAADAGLGHLNVRALVLDGQTVLAGTQGGGVFKSSDGGANWAAANTGLSHLDVYSLALDGQTVLAGTWDGGVFKSSDGGANWAVANTGLGNLRVRALALDGQTVLAGTAYRSVFKSANGALSSESRLLSLELFVAANPVALSPAFGSATLAYTATVQGAGGATLTPTAWINDATITVNGMAVASGSTSAPIALDSGSNSLSVVVTSGDGTSTRTYTVTVTRQVVAPAAPTNVQAVLGAPGTGQATVSWTPSAASGSSALAGYTVAGGGSNCTAGPGDNSCVVTGLANGTAYSFTVTAANAEGATAMSSQSNSVTPLGANAITFPVQAGQAYTSGGSFAISPAATGLSSAPVIYGSLSTGICTVAGSTVTSVGAGTCTLSANQAGDAAWAAAPQATQTVAIGQGVNTITFPAQAGQTYATGGTFAINPVATGLSSASVVYTSLTGGVCSVTGAAVAMVSAGTCTIEAAQAGDANWAAATPVQQSLAISASAPGAPTGVTATPTASGQVTVSWTPPANDGGGITQYTVTALVNGQPSGQGCTATPPATSCTVTGLQDGVTYTFSVQAENAAGSAAAPAPTNPATPLANAKAFSAMSPTGTGTVGVMVAGGGATCAFESVQLVSAASVGAPTTRNFPHGVLDFVLHACDATPVTVTVTYPPGTPLPGAQYWKRQGGTWAPFAGAVLGVNTAVLTLEDGGVGDEDGVPMPNGRIVDPGGLSWFAAPVPGGTAAIPTLSQWGLMLLAALLGWMAFAQQAGVRKR